MLLFSYGANTPARLAAHLGHAVKTEPAYLPNHARVFRGWSTRWRGGVATILPARGVMTFGHVAAVTPADLEVLDRVEDVPFAYRRARVVVHLPRGTPVSAWAYVAERTDFHPPSQQYLKAVAQTINHHWSSEDGAAITWRDVDVR